MRLPCPLYSLTLFVCLSTNRREGPRVAVLQADSAARQPSSIDSWSQCARKCRDWGLPMNRWVRRSARFWTVLWCFGIIKTAGSGDWLQVGGRRANGKAAGDCRSPRRCREDGGATEVLGHGAVQKGTGFPCTFRVKEPKSSGSSLRPSGISGTVMLWINDPIT